MQQRKYSFANVKWSIAALLAIASVMIVASGASQATAATPDATPQVIINNYAFAPPVLTVKVGTTVTWINHDDDPHAVDSAQGKFKSKVLEKDEKFEFHFTEAGEYPFACRLHPKMTGKVVVQP